jgi:hypothetical protein
VRDATEKSKPPPIVIEPIVVPETISKLHPCLKDAMADIRRASKNVFQHRRWRGTIPVLASEAALDRALRIMNALMLTLEARGWHVEVRARPNEGAPWRRAETGVHVGKAFVPFLLFERTNMLRTGRPPAKRRDETPEETETREFWPRVRSVPNGNLTIRIPEEYGPETEWTDRSTRRLETCLHEVVAGIMARADAIRARAVERANDLEVQREREKLRADAEKRRREEEEDVAKLRATLADWREVRDTRAFIDEARAIVAAAGQVIQEGSPLDKFIKWATARNDQFDPLRVLRKEAAECAKAAASGEGQDRSP